MARKRKISHMHFKADLGSDKDFLEINDVSSGINHKKISRLLGERKGSLGTEAILPKR